MRIIINDTLSFNLERSNYEYFVQGQYHQLRAVLAGVQNTETIRSSLSELGESTDNHYNIVIEVIGNPNHVYENYILKILHNNQQRLLQK